MVAAEYADYDDGASTTGMAAKYSMGNITLGAENQQAENALGADTKDLTVMFVKYNLGGGVTAYVEAASDDNSADQNTFGIAYSF